MKHQVLGRAVNGSGEAIPGAEVIVWRPSSDPQSEYWTEFALASTATDATGRYCLEFETDEADDSKPLFLAWRTPGFGAHEYWLNMSRPIPRFLRLPDIRLGSSAGLAGRVLDDQGRPAAGLRIRIGPNCSIHEPAPGYMGLSIVRCETDQDGRFETQWANLGTSPHLEVLTKTGEFILREFSPDIREEIEIRLPPLGSIQGKVFDRESGEPLQGASVSLEEDRSLHMFQVHRFVSTDDHGRFEFLDLPASEYRVTVRGQQRRADIENIKVHAGERVSLDLAAGKAIDLSGVVVLADGSPVPGMTLYAINAGFAQSCLTGHTDREGHFVFEGLPPGTHRLNLVVSGVETETKTVQLSVSEAPKPLRFELQGKRADSELLIRVVDAGGHPVPGAWVSTDMVPVQLAGADEHGRCALPFLPGSAGTALRRVFALSPDRSMIGVRRPEGEWNDGQELEIRLDRPLKKVRSRVVDIPKAGRLQTPAFLPRANLGRLPRILCGRSIWLPSRIGMAFSRSGPSMPNSTTLSRDPRRAMFPAWAEGPRRTCSPAGSFPPSSSNERTPIFPAKPWKRKASRYLASWCKRMVVELIRLR